MGFIPEEIIDDIFQRVSIAEVIGEYLSLQRKGNRLLGLCPFHNEKTPSFSVNDERGMFYCFGCQESGNTATFLMKHDGLSFPEAVRRLADRVDITIPETTHSSNKRKKTPSKTERERYFEVSKFAQQFYEKMLWNGQFAEAQVYLMSRDVDEKTAKAFGLGFAPEGWSSLIDSAKKVGISEEELFSVGLVSRRKNGSGFYDRFRRRIMFPVYALGKRIVAFSGRTLDPEEQAKYINSPETKFYTKGNELYGLHAAQRAIRKADQAVLVEGNFDVVSLHAHKIPIACAALGTALTENQIRLVFRFTKRIILIFDGDSAGQKAAQKALRLLLKMGAEEILYVPLKDGEDPDTFVRTADTNAEKTLLERAVPMLQHSLDIIITDHLASDRQRNPAKKQQTIKKLSELLTNLSDGFLWKEHVRRLAPKLELSVKKLTFQLRQPFTQSAKTSSNHIVSLDAYEATLVWILGKDSSFLEQIAQEHLYGLIVYPQLKNLLQVIAPHFVTHKSPTFIDAIHSLEEGPPKQTFFQALFQELSYQEKTIKTLFVEIILRLKMRWIKSEKEQLANQIIQMDEMGEINENLLKKDAELNRLLQNLELELEEKKLVISKIT